jgi:hypothetical protein
VKQTKTLGQGTADAAKTLVIGSSYLDLAFQISVPQDLQTCGFFEAFEGTWEPSVRAFVVDKKLIHRWTALSLVPRDLLVTQEAAGQVNLATLE